MTTSLKRYPELHRDLRGQKLVDLVVIALLAVAALAVTQDSKADDLLSKFKLSNIYVDAALIHSNVGEARMYPAPTTVLPRYSGPTNHVTERLPTDEDKVVVPPSSSSASQPSMASNGGAFILDDRANNPYLRIAIGYDVQWSLRWSTRLDYSHESSIATGKDHGVERLTLGVTWRPFGSAR